MLKRATLSYDVPSPPFGERNERIEQKGDQYGEYHIGEHFRRVHILAKFNNAMAKTRKCCNRLGSEDREKGRHEAHPQTGEDRRKGSRQHYIPEHLDGGGSH